MTAWFRPDSPEGRAALAAVLAGAPILGFDFDGTLAPIVDHPADARVPPALAHRLALLARRWPVAVLTGRSLPDVASRLGFVPQHLVGHHGAQEAGQALHAIDASAVAALLHRLQRHAVPLAAAGVELEDKGLSLALHYRRAPDVALALDCIDTLLATLDPSLRRFGGHSVVNIAPAQAPDKGEAMWSVVRRFGATSAVYVGDDVNDEPVFERAAPHWLTLRIGDDKVPSRARHRLASQAEVPALVDAMLALG
ncbi:trehalose-phosphatase [Ideonella sp. A 288]|uniref:trehalose-phosphatase n=1 Tax=Ideonella sp. A 288 TaxID=1962181 RepID=UPI000B4BC6EF|nr:trehalose-phosphatase [Ideonella sp. A 288]